MHRLFLCLTLFLGSLLNIQAADIKGDINGDGKLTIDDANLLAEMCLGLKSSTTYADINGDGALSVTDVTKLVDMILHKKEGGMDVGIDGWEDSGEDYGGTVSATSHRIKTLSTGATIVLPYLMLTPGETTELGITMNNTSAINGFQFAITLPDGFELQEASLLRKTSSHVLMTNGAKTGTIRLLSYSTSNATFTGSTGEVLKLRIKACNTEGNYKVQISDQEFSNAAFDAIRPADVTASTTVKKQYTITASASNGGTVELIHEGLSVSSPFTAWGGTEIVLSATPLTGYHFEAWSDGNKDNPRKLTLNADKTLTATFAPNNYTITYKVDGVVYKTQTYAFGEKITPEKEPTKEGHTFSGWSEIPETMPAENVVVTGAFSVNSYTITYLVDGEVYKTQTYNYGEKVVPEEEPAKEGHTFSGWSEIPKTMPAKDVEVTGAFSVNSYTITYKVNGEVYKTQTYTFGEKITPEKEPTKEGHTFSGWSEIPKTMPAKDVEVTGAFSVNSYTITYLVDGEVYKTQTYNFGEKVVPEEKPAKEGYTFSGWSEIPQTMLAKNVVVTGTFTVNYYTIIYKVDGEAYKTQAYTFGEKIVPEKEPTKEGHTFSGWSEIPKTMPAKDVEVTGTFSINSYTITYIVDGEVYKTQTYNFGEKVVPEEEPAKEGYTFSGWSEIPQTMLAKNVVVTGTFTVNFYTIIYKVDGEAYKTQAYTFGEKIVPEKEPTKEGHTFSGWSEIPKTMPAKDVEVTGTFSINSYTITYIVDGEVYKIQTYAFGEEITPEEEPTKEGHTFRGWSEIPKTMPAKNVVVTGTFIDNSYTITYIVDGEVYKTLTYNFGEEITPEEEPTKEGYTFSGWSEIPQTMPAKDVVVTGAFIANSYTITYMVDGEVYKTETYAFGEKITPEKEPTKEGHAFSGWSEIPETMPAENVVVTGAFIANSYTITYMVDGEVYKTETYAFGEKITPEKEPTKEGYTFNGWSEIPETMPAENVVVTGAFSVNSYTITYMVDGEVYKSQTYTFGEKIVPEEEPTKEGYTFSGWSAIPETMPAENVVVTGAFSVNSYTITYMVDGEVYKSHTYTFGEKIVPEEEPTKEGYTFNGWSEIPETMPAENMVVTGAFSVNSYTITYMVDGEVYKTQMYTFGEKIVPEKEPTKEGYIFSGWSEIPETMPAEDIVVTGTFEGNAILSVTRDEEDTPIYDLSGKLVSKNYKGLVIKNGRKILQK